MQIKSCVSNREALEKFKDSKIFYAYYEVLIVAASIGFQRESRRKIDKTDKTIELYLFESFSGFNAIYYGIALAEEKNQDILQENEETQAKRFKFFEEYANGGLDILKREVLDRPGDILENLLLFLKKEGAGFSDDPSGNIGKKFDFSFGLM